MHNPSPSTIHSPLSLLCTFVCLRQFENLEIETSKYLKIQMLELAKFKGCTFKV
jgi:hypothetical protein